MTTVVDPLGTPIIAFNRSGKNIQSIVANAGTAFVDAVEITHVSEETIVFVDTTGGSGSGAVYFASDFDLGDTVTLHGANGYVYDSAGNFLDYINGYLTFIWKDPTSGFWRRIG
jgi:hypothetical protein